MAKLCWTVESAVPSVPGHRIRSSGLNLISWNILEINSLGLNGLLVAGMGSWRKLCTFIPLSFFPRVKGHHPGMLGTWLPLITSNRDSFPRSPLRKVLPFHLLLGNEGNVFQSTPFLFPWAAKEGESSLCPAPPPIPHMHKYREVWFFFVERKSWWGGRGSEGSEVLAVEGLVGRSDVTAQPFSTESRHSPSLFPTTSGRLAPPQRYH